MQINNFLFPSHKGGFLVPPLTLSMLTTIYFFYTFLPGPIQLARYPIKDNMRHASNFITMLTQFIFYSQKKIFSKFFLKQAM